jgi:tetratricopeptide (TPR) repeat protein
MFKKLLTGSAATCLFLCLPVGASAHGGGGGFHGGGGGFHGGGFGGFHGGGFSGFHGGGVGGYGGFHGGYSAPSFNRTPSFSTPRSSFGQFGNVGRFNSFNNVNRAGSFNNINRFNSFNNVNRFNTVNSLNRVNNFNTFNHSTTFNNLNVAHRGGLGWRNPYWGYHSGWMHGYWNGHYPGGWGWNRYWGGYPGYWWGGGLGLGVGLGLGWGLSPWLFGPMLYDWGYSSYYNPYYAIADPTVVASQPVIYDYSQPITSVSQAPEETVMTQATTLFDGAREAFKTGDYPRALDLADQCLKQTPNDSAVHEFRALVLFALKRYDEAAAALYAVLSVGPGWDWTTLISLYADPETYTQQLRALEDYCTQSPNLAPPRFVLAYQYLTEGFSDAAIRQLKNVVALQPKDQLSAQLLGQLEQKEQAPAGGDLASAPSPAGTAASPSPTEATSNAKAGDLTGAWTAQPSADVAITLTFGDKGHFVWKVSRQGKDQQFDGTSTYESGILTMVQQQNNSNVMVGNVAWKDDDHFTFKVLGGGPNDPGLSFAKSR